MSRIVFLLVTTGILLILATGIGAIWVTSSDMAKSRQTASEALVKGVGLSIGARIDIINQTLDRMAQDPDVLLAITSNNAEAIMTVTSRLERNFPGALKVRLLLPEVTELDISSSPKMTLADLDMVREAQSSTTVAAIHGDDTKDRHLAVARKVSRDKETVGILLVSLKYDFIGNSLKSGRDGNNGYFQLNQDKMVLATSGARPNSDNVIKSSFTIPGTLWELEYQAPYTASLDYTALAGIIGVPTLLFLIVFVIGYLKLSKLLMNDLSSVMTAFKDMKKNKFRDNYPIGLKEFNVVISALAQYKRLEDQEEEEESTDSNIRNNDEFNDRNPTSTQSSWHELEVKPGKIDASPIESPKTPIKTKDDNARTANLFQNFDICGQFGSILTRDLVYNIGRALGSEAIAQSCQTLAIARDSQKTNQELAEAMMQGIIATGCNVLDIGMAPAPMLYFVAHHLEGRSGVMVTSKSESASQSSLIMIIKGETLAGNRIQQLKQRIEQQAFTTSPSPGKKERMERYGNEYIGVLSEDIHIARPMKVVLDCGNGIAGKIAPTLLRTIGCEIIELFCDIDPSYPNHPPNPRKPEYLDDLIKSVTMSHADVGIAFNGDGSCLGVVDSNGRLISPDRQMMLYAKDVLTGKPGAEVLYDVKCSRHLADQITKCGGRPVMWKSGHVPIKAKLRETGAKLAGELSGHIYFNDRWFGFDDALYTACRLIEILSADSRSSAEVFAELPDSVVTPELHAALPDGENQSLMDRLSASAKFTGGKITSIDGLRVDFPNGWGLVRASNNMPALMFRFEADTKDAIKSIQELFKQQIIQLKPDIILPF